MKWLVSYQARVVYYRPDGGKRHGDTCDFIAVWDEHPAIVIAKQRHEINTLETQPPFTGSLDVRSDEIVRIYSAVPMDGVRIPREQMEYLV